MSVIEGYEDQSGHGSEAEPGSGLPAYIEGGVIEGAALQRAYVLSGERPGSSLRFTLENTKTGRHFTYQVEVARGPVGAGEGRRRLVSVLGGVLCSVCDGEGGWGPSAGGDNMDMDPCGVCGGSGRASGYSYLGVIFDKGKKVQWPGGLKSRWRGRKAFDPDGVRYVWTAYPYYHGKKSRIGRDALSALGFRYLWAYLTEGKDLPGNLRFWHEGRCGRCGRTLTDPESIARGLGPICAGTGP